MDRTYRAGIIGLSGISMHKSPPFLYPILGSIPYHSHVAAYTACTRTDIAAVCDIAEEKIAGFRQEWAEEWPQTRAYGDYREMLEKEDLDIVSVVTSDHLHAGMVVDAAAAGVKAIFCEKPMATTVEDCDLMLDAIHEHGVVVSVNHTRRWMPEFCEARQLLNSGEIGRLLHVTATMGGPRAMLFRNLTHSVDVIQFYAQSDPDWVFSDLEPGYDGYGPAYAGDGGHDPATDPACNAYITFKNGVRAYLAGIKESQGGRTFELIGEKGFIRLNATEAELWKNTDGGGLVGQHIGREQSTMLNMHAAVEELVDAIETGKKKTSAPPEEARMTTAILLGILRSHHESHSVVKL